MDEQDYVKMLIFSL